MLLELRIPWAHKFGKSVYHYVLIFLSWLDHQDTKGSEKFRNRKKQKQKHRRRPTERLKWYSRWELLSALCPQTRKEAFFPPYLLYGMVQEQSTLILLKMEEAAEGNLVVNPFERDEARGVWALWQNTIFFFLNELSISRFIFMASLQFLLAFAENDAFSPTCNLCWLNISAFSVLTFQDISSPFEWFSFIFFFKLKKV